MSVCQRALERLDAELSGTDDEGRLLTYNEVAAFAVVGNEDGIHEVSAGVFQGLNDIGFSLSRRGGHPWVREAQRGTDFQDLKETPDAVKTTTHTLAANAVHLAHQLTGHPCPPRCNPAESP